MYEQCIRPIANSWFQEDWIIETNNPPPKNATWILYYFRGDGRSPAAIMRALRLFNTRTQNQSDDSDSSEGGHVQPRLSPDLSMGGYAHESLLSSLRTVHFNIKGERLDVPLWLNPDREVGERLQNYRPRLCNYHYLIGKCTTENCAYAHDMSLTYDELKALAFLSRTQRCTAGTSCAWPYCTRGHMCPNGTECRHGRFCRFIDTHGIDTTITKTIP